MSKPEPRWDIDKARGDAAEKWVSDIRAGLEGDASIEVKRDKALSTGNLYVEYECRGKPSGIATTKADLWVFVLDLDHFAIVISTERLKALARSFYRAGRIGECVVGSHPTKGVLIPLDRVMRLWSRAA